LNALRAAADRYLAALQSGSFKTDASGVTVFFPYGFLGRGYLITPDQEALIRGWIGRFYVVTFIAIVISVTIIRFGALLLIVPALAVYWLWARRAVAGLPVAATRMTYREVGRSQAKAFGSRWLTGLLVLSTLFTAASFAMLGSPKNQLIGALGVVLFGLGSIRFAALLIQTRRD
jgi:hypothetical protein